MNNSINIALSNDQVQSIVTEFGSPVYVFHKDAFTENYINLLYAFRSIYPKYNIAYSYKTNYTPYICEIVKELGGYAEVVSGMEYQLARKVGYDNGHIIFNGPVKGQEKYEHLSGGGVVNVDNLDELDGIIDFTRSKASSTGTVYKLAFRVNIDIGQGFISRFGIDSDNGDLGRAFALVKAGNSISVVGIHCHIGHSRSIEAWKNRLQRMFEIIDRFFIEPPMFIDLGSGMNSVMEAELAQQFAGDLPTYKDYAGVVASAFAEKYEHLTKELQPELITEPGTTVVSGYLSFLATVLSIRTIKGKTFATFDGSVGNMGDICQLKQLPITVHHIDQAGEPGQQEQRENPNAVVAADFVGYTCLEHDVMYKEYNGPLNVRDIVEFRNVGSYSNVFKPPFIYPNCAMVALEGKRDYRLIKRRETIDDVFETYLYLRGVKC